MMSHAMMTRERHDEGKAITVLHCISDMLHIGARIRHHRRPDQPQSFAEKNRLFSEASRAVVSCMLNGKLKIHRDDIKLDAQAFNGGAIFIDEHVSNNAEFQKMWAETSCQEILKTLAQKALQG